MTLDRPGRRTNAALTVSIVACLVILVALVGTAVTVWAGSDNQVVQGTELDRAGSQRQLAERIALDVTLLDGRSTATADVAAELESAARTLERTRTGLLSGDDDYGLDGQLPDSVVELYSADGLDLAARLAAYEEAAVAVASGTATDDDIATIRTEADGQRLVRDLDVLVAEMSRIALDGQRTNELLIDVGLGVLLLVGVGALASLWIALRASREQTRLGDRLADELVESETTHRNTVDSMAEVHRETLDSLTSAILVLDEDGDVVLVNRMAARLLGRFAAGQPGDLDSGGSSLPPVFGVDGRPRRLDGAELLAGIDADDATGNELIGARLADGVHWFQSSATPVRDALTDRRLVVLVLREVTAEKQLTEQLEVERTRFRLAFEEAPIGKAIVAADGTFVEMNRAVCDLLQRSRSELFGARFQDMTHPDDLDADLALLQELVDGRADTYRLEKRYLSPSGEVIHALLSVSAVRPEGGEIYFIAQIIDLHEQKEMEEFQSEALEREREIVRSLRELSDAKTNFVSTVSHELRTPLTSMLGYAEMLIDETGGELTEMQADMLDVIDRNGRRLLELIEDLLTVTTIDSGSISLNLDAVAVDELVGSVAESMMPIARRNAVTLDVPIRLSDVVVPGDRTQLERVLTNLVSNAIKFTPADGRVTIDVSADDAHVTISVTDSGVGIPRSEQDQVFERFFRTSSSHEQAIPGTGLGLAIASDLVEAHGGSIRLSSEPGIGTHVWFTLPLDEAGRSEVEDDVGSVDDGDEATAVDVVDVAGQPVAELPAARADESVSNQVPDQLSTVG